MTRILTIAECLPSRGRLLPAASTFALSVKSVCKQGSEGLSFTTYCRRRTHSALSDPGSLGFRAAGSLLAQGLWRPSKPLLCTTTTVLAAATAETQTPQQHRHHRAGVNSLPASQLLSGSQPRSRGVSHTDKSGKGQTCTGHSKDDIATTILTLAVTGHVHRIHHQQQQLATLIVPFQGSEAPPPP